MYPPSNTLFVQGGLNIITIVLLFHCKYCQLLFAQVNLMIFEENILIRENVYRYLNGLVMHTEYTLQKFIEVR